MGNVHDCPHCECAGCAFCGKHLKDAKHTIAWDYYSPPKAYSKKKGHDRDEQAVMCNACAKKIDYVLSMLQYESRRVTAADVVDVADHPKLREEDSHSKEEDAGDGE